MALTAASIQRTLTERAKQAIIDRLQHGEAGYSELRGIVRMKCIQAGMDKPTDEIVRDIMQDARDALIAAGRIVLVTYQRPDGHATVHRLVTTGSGSPA